VTAAEATGETPQENAQITTRGKFTEGYVSCQHRHPGRRKHYTSDHPDSEGNSPMEAVTRPHRPTRLQGTQM